MSKRSSPKLIDYNDNSRTDSATPWDAIATPDYAAPEMALTPMRAQGETPLVDPSLPRFPLPHFTSSSVKTNGMAEFLRASGDAGTTLPDCTSRNSNSPIFRRVHSVTGSDSSNQTSSSLQHFSAPPPRSLGPHYSSLSSSPFPPGTLGACKYSQDYGSLSHLMSPLPYGSDARCANREMATQVFCGGGIPTSYHDVMASALTRAGDEACASLESKGIGNEQREETQMPISREARTSIVSVDSCISSVRMGESFLMDTSGIHEDVDAASIFGGEDSQLCEVSIAEADRRQRSFASQQTFSAIPRDERFPVGTSSGANANDDNDDHRAAISWGDGSIRSGSQLLQKQNFSSLLGSFYQDASVGEEDGGTHTPSPPPSMKPSGGNGDGSPNWSGEKTPRRPTTPPMNLIAATTYTPASAALLQAQMNGVQRHRRVSQPSTPQKSVRRPMSRSTTPVLSFDARVMNMSMESRGGAFTSVASVFNRSATTSLCCRKDYLAPDRNPFSPYRVTTLPMSSSSLAHSILSRRAFLPRTMEAPRKRRLRGDAAVVIYAHTVPQDDPLGPLVGGAADASPTILSIPSSRRESMFCTVDVHATELSRNDAAATWGPSRVTEVFLKKSATSDRISPACTASMSLPGCSQKSERWPREGRNKSNSVKNSSRRGSAAFTEDLGSSSLSSVHATNRWKQRLQAAQLCASHGDNATVHQEGFGHNHKGEATKQCEEPSNSMPQQLRSSTEGDGVSETPGSDDRKAALQLFSSVSRVSCEDMMFLATTPALEDAPHGLQLHRRSSVTFALENSDSSSSTHTTTGGHSARKAKESTPPPHHCHAVADEFASSVTAAVNTSILIIGGESTNSSGSPAGGCRLTAAPQVQLDSPSPRKPASHRPSFHMCKHAECAEEPAAMSTVSADRRLLFGDAQDEEQEREEEKDEYAVDGVDLCSPCMTQATATPRSTPRQSVFNNVRQLVDWEGAQSVSARLTPKSSLCPRTALTTPTALTSRGSSTSTVQPLEHVVADGGQPLFDHKRTQQQQQHVANSIAVSVSTPRTRDELYSTTAEGSAVSPTKVPNASTSLLPVLPSPPQVQCQKPTTFSPCGSITEQIDGSCIYVDSSSSEASSVLEGRNGQRDQALIEDAGLFMSIDVVEDDEEEEVEPGDRFVMHHRFQFLHYVPQISAQGFAIPLAVDATGVVWLATHRLDGMPYAVKEIPPAHAAAHLAVELECLTLGNDPVTPLQVQADMFISRYYSCYSSAINSARLSAGFEGSSSSNVDCGEAHRAHLLYCEYFPLGSVWEWALDPFRIHSGNDNNMSKHKNDEDAASAYRVAEADDDGAAGIHIGSHKAAEQVYKQYAYVSLPELHWCRIVKDGLHALEALHGHALVHGCPLPTCLYLATEDLVKLAHFGSAVKSPTAYPLGTVPAFLLPEHQIAQTEVQGEVEKQGTATYDAYSTDVHVLISGVAWLMYLCHEQECGESIRGIVPVDLECAQTWAPIQDFVRSASLGRFGGVCCGSTPAFYQLLLSALSKPWSAKELLENFSATPLNIRVACTLYDEEIQRLSAECEALEKELRSDEEAAPGEEPAQLSLQRGGTEQFLAVRTSSCHGEDAAPHAQHHRHRHADPNIPMTLHAPQATRVPLPGSQQERSTTSAATAHSAAAAATSLACLSEPSALLLPPSPQLCPQSTDTSILSSCLPTSQEGHSADTSLHQTAPQPAKHHQSKPPLPPHTEGLLKRSVQPPLSPSLRVCVGSPLRGAAPVLRLTDDSHETTALATPASPRFDHPRQHSASSIRQLAFVHSRTHSSRPLHITDTSYYTPRSAYMPHMGVSDVHAPVREAARRYVSCAFPSELQPCLRTLAGSAEQRLARSVRIAQTPSFAVQLTWAALQSMRVRGWVRLVDGVPLPKGSEDHRESISEGRLLRKNIAWDAASNCLGSAATTEDLWVLRPLTSYE